MKEFQAEFKGGGRPSIRSCSGQPGSGRSRKISVEILGLDPWSRPRGADHARAGSTANTLFLDFHLPRVKSGHSTGALPEAMDFSDKGMTTLITTES